MHCQSHYTKSEWIAIFLGELLTSGPSHPRPRVARSMALQAMALHDDLSPVEALRIWRRDHAATRPLNELP